jgi:hypothetical protein
MTYPLLPATGRSEGGIFMKHIATMSKAPAMAFCENAPTSQEEAKMCFLLELSTGFFLPAFATKNGTTSIATSTDDTTTESVG